MEIRNKIEIKRGGFIQVPGCEPLSDLTSNTLLANFKCKNTIVTLEQAMAAIPDATIETTYNPTTNWFVLPDGPPSKFGCEGLCQNNDWYAILRNIGEEEEESIGGDCSPPTDSFQYFGAL